MSYERRDSDEVDETWGYVHSAGVEQEGNHDSIQFKLTIYYKSHSPNTADEVFSTNWDFLIYLDMGTTVALAQLQLLRDAMLNTWLVKVRYWQESEDESRQATAIRVYPNKVFPTTINEDL